MRITAKLTAIALLAVSTSLPTIAQAESTGWILGTQWLKISRNLNQQGKYATAVQCKDSGKPGLTLTVL